MNKKILVGIIVVIIAIVGVFIYLGSSDVILESTNAQVTLPSDYTINSDSNDIAVRDNVGVGFTAGSIDKSDLDKLWKTLKSNGKSAGYEHVQISEINGFKVYEFGANPDKLKKVSSDKEYGSTTYTWMEYKPLTPAFEEMTTMDVVYFRDVLFFNKLTGRVSELVIFTDDSNIDLYSAEFQNIVESISVLES